jgi:hypothetical protein
LQQAELPGQVQEGEPSAVWELVLRQRLGPWELLPVWVEQLAPDRPDEVAAT